jgi:hypothetical protein
LEIPNFVAWFESAKNAGLERTIANALVSGALSGYLTGLWRSGDAKWATWTGEGQALKDAATAMYLTLSQLETKDFLVLTLPQDMLDPNNLSRFQSERRTK